MTAVAHHDFGTGPVVGGKENECVLIHAHRFELRDDAPNLLVHTINHRCMDGHFGRLEAALLVGQFVPRKRSVHFTGAELFHRIRKGVGRSDLALQRGKSGAGDTCLSLPGETRGANHFPAGEIAIAILRDILRQRMQRKVRRDKRDVMKEGSAGVICGVILQTCDGVISRGDGRVIALFIRGRCDGHIVDGIAPGGEEVSLILHVERTIKAGGEHLAVDVPLAAVVAPIAGRFQILG